MATITIANFLDGGTARTAGEAMTINSGGKLTIRTDTRVHANAPTANEGSLGSVTINEGELIWDSTAVRWIPFNAGTGNVPAIGTTITQGAVSGYFLGVWASKTVANTAVGAAMPTSGFIKFREVTGGNFSSGALSGIGASATGPDVQGWISIAHDAASNFTVPRLGKHTARGGKFFLETTTGVLGQIFQVPTEGSAVMYAPGLWIETGVGTDEYEYWPGLYSSTNGWAHQHIGEAKGYSDARQNFLKILAGGQLQMGEDYTQASTYASLAAQSSTYAGVSHTATYTWDNNKITVFCSSNHIMMTGEQTGLEFTSGAAVGSSGIFTVTVLTERIFTVDLVGSGSGGAATSRPRVSITFTAHGLNTGEQVYCDFTSGSCVDGTFTILSIPATSTYTIPYPSITSITSGNVSCIHTLVVTFTAHGLALGNKVYLDFTSGTAVDGMFTIKAVATNTYNINFPHSTITSGNVTMRRQIGNVVEAGRRTWIPSNILNECATGARATNTVPNTTIASRPEWTTTSAGAIDLEYVYGCSGYFTFAQAFSVRLRNCSFFDTLIISECATALDVEESNVSMQGAIDTITLALTSNFAGGIVKKGKFHRGNAPGTSDHAASIQYCKGIVFDGIQAGIIQYARSTGYPFVFNGCSDIELNNSRPINGPVSITISSDVSINDHDHCDRYTGRTNATGPNYAVVAGAGCSNITVDGVTAGFVGTIEDCHPHMGILNYTACSNAKLRNVGSMASKFNAGIWATNTYSMAYLCLTGGNNDGVKIQRCYTTPCRSGPFTNTNSDKNVLIESVDCGIYSLAAKAVLAMVHADLNGQIKGVTELWSNTGQASVYGTHFLDIFHSYQRGSFILVMNEPSEETSAQFTLVSGTAKFNSSGGVILGAIGTQAIWEDNVFRKGHDYFSTAPVMTGGTIGNYTIEFQKDVGSGYGGTWLDAKQLINLNVQTVDPAIGFRIKLRITTTTTNTAAITSITFGTTSTYESQQNQYPLDQVKLKLTGLVSGSDVVILASGTETVLNTAEDVNATFYDYLYETPTNVDISIYKPGYKPHTTIRNYSLGLSDSSIPVVQEEDPSYLD